MKLIKSLLLGSAAGLVAVAGAQAADLGVKKPTAVEYVKTCPTYGAGFFVVPGTTSCLKLIGRVRADYMIDNPLTRASNANRFRVRGYVGFDHRTATEYGLLRTYARAFFQRQNGADSTTLEYAFVQFGGLTAGRITPVVEHGYNQFFHFSGYGDYGYHSDSSYVNSIGYTFNAGGGFSATVALDDPSDRRLTVNGGGGYMGKRAPDLVASLDYAQAWGSVKLAGVVRQVGVVTPGIDTKYGYAILGAAKFNIAALGKGSNLWVSASYGQGTTNYQGFGSGFALGQFAAPVTIVNDGAVVGTAIKLTTSYALMGALQVFVAPTVSVSLGATYANVDAPGAANTIRTWSALGQVAWTPVPGFLIGAEAVYRSVSASTGVIAAGTDKSDIVGRLRVQRDF